jgi:hypothetical protein
VIFSYFVSERCCWDTVTAYERECLLYFGQVDYYFGVGILSLSAIRTNSARESAPIFSITWWR